MKQRETIRGASLALAAAATLSACTPPAAAPTPGGNRLPPVPVRSGPLAIDVVYPGEGQRLGVRDSTFLFGSVGTGAARLRINGAPVEVAANGAFLAFLPVPEDGRYRLEAAAGGDTVRAERMVRLPATPAVPAGGLSIEPGSVSPRGAVVETEGETLTVRLRGTPGATARLVLPDGRVVPLVEQAAEERAEGFMLDRQTVARGVAEYTGTLVVRAPLVAADRSVPWPTLGGMPEPPRGAGRGAVVELIRGADTVRTPLDLSLAVLPAGLPRVALAATGRGDGMVIGTSVPGSGTPYHWFFPNGTRLTVTGARGGQYRVRLTERQSVWVDTGEVRLLPTGTPAPRGTVGSVGVRPYREHVELRLATSERLPFRVDGSERGLTVTVYGAETRTNWLQYGATDPLVRRLEWEQVADDEYRLRVELSEPLWGFLPHWSEGGQLVVRIRRPPALDPRAPLRGVYVGVDAGHPPGGAIGPTRLTEAQANLEISKRLIALLEARGARVLEIRPDSAAVALGARPQLATDSSVHVLVSVHNNAFPDGVNPFENNGTSVFYNQAQSLDLARALQAELLRELGLRDLGIARADLALVRPTWMPSALTESMFLMVPQQEAALRDPQVQERVARAHLRALETFLRGRAAFQR